MKKIFIGLISLTSLSTFASDCDSLIGDYLCSSKYSSRTVQIEKRSSGYKVIEIRHTRTPFSEPNDETDFNPKCVGSNKLDYKESYLMATFFIKIRPVQEGIQVESGFEEAQKTGTEICLRK